MQLRKTLTWDYYTKNRDVNNGNYNAQMLILAKDSRGLNQKQLSALTGINPKEISELENAKRIITADHIEKIAKALNYPESFFRQWDFQVVLPNLYWLKNH